MTAKPSSAPTTPSVQERHAILLTTVASTLRVGSHVRRAELERAARVDALVARNRRLIAVLGGA